MKTLMMTAIALLTLNATAQDRPYKKDILNDFTAEEVATLKTKKMTIHLDLTEEQESQVEDIVFEEEVYHEKLRAERREKKKNHTDDNPSKEARFAIMNEQLDRKIKMKKKMKNILNAAQYAKWETSLEQREEKRRQKKRSER